MVDYEIEHYRRREIRIALKRADPAFLEPALLYLEGDPRTFGSGYIKEMIWQYIRRYDLQPEHIERLEKSALQYLLRPMSREFKYMCQTMCRIASRSFWDKVEAELDTDNPRVQINATCLFAYSKGIMPGEKQRLEFKYGLRRPLYDSVHPYTTPEAFLILLKEQDNWIDGIAVEYDTLQKMAITSPQQPYDEGFLRLDYSAMKSEAVLPKIRHVLNTGNFSIFNYFAWYYALHVLGQLKDANAVPIIIEFLENRIDWKFDGPLKSGLEYKALAVLRSIDTPETREIVRQRDENADYGD